MINMKAIIEDGAIIGEGTIIEPFAYVSKDAKIGKNCIIKQGARIVGDTTIGDNSTIYSYAIVGDIPQDISYKKEQKTGLIIGKNATIREFCTINSGTSKGDGYTRIGDNAFIMAYCHIAHDCILRDNVILANNATLAGHVEIGDFSVVGGLTPIHQFVKVGSYCMIAGASALSQDVPDFCLVEGNRAYVRGLNIVGLRRHKSKEVIDELHKAYIAIFRSGKDIKEMARQYLESANSDELKKMCNFILSTTRGIPVKRKYDE